MQQAMQYCWLPTPSLHHGAESDFPLYCRSPMPSAHVYRWFCISPQIQRRQRCVCSWTGVVWCVSVCRICMMVKCVYSLCTYDLFVLGWAKVQSLYPHTPSVEFIGGDICCVSSLIECGLFLESVSGFVYC